MCSVAQSCLTCCALLIVAHQAPLSVGFSRQEYWSGLPFPPGDLPDPGVEPVSPLSPCIGRQILLPQSHLGSLLVALIQIVSHIIYFGS